MEFSERFCLLRLASCHLINIILLLVLLYFWNTCFVSVILVSSTSFLPLQSSDGTKLTPCRLRFIPHPLEPQEVGRKKYSDAGESNAISTIAGVVLTPCNEGGLASTPNQPLFHFNSEILNWNFLFVLKKSLTYSHFLVYCCIKTPLDQGENFQLVRSFVCKIKLQKHWRELVWKNMHEKL
jgi:hypothetical protein